MNPPRPASFVFLFLLSRSSWKFFQKPSLHGLLSLHAKLLPQGVKVHNVLSIVIIRLARKSVHRGQLFPVIPAERDSASAGIHNHRSGLWIPGSRASLAPRNDRGAAHPRSRLSTSAVPAVSRPC